MQGYEHEIIMMRFIRGTDDQDTIGAFTINTGNQGLLLQSLNAAAVEIVLDAIQVKCLIGAPDTDEMTMQTRMADQGPAQVNSFCGEITKQRKEIMRHGCSQTHRQRPLSLLLPGLVKKADQLAAKLSHAMRLKLLAQ